MRTNLFIAIVIAAIFAACQPKETKTLSGLDPNNYVSEVDGKQTQLIVLKNKQGMEVCITNYGARVVSLMAPDRNGKMEDVVTGFASVDEYVSQNQNFGSTVGRYIGRIAGPSFVIDSIEYKLQGYGKSKQISHGGKPGFANRVWNIEKIAEDSVLLSYLSPDGENGFPGNLQVYLTYFLRDDNALDIHYEATTDAPTVLNLSHHSFFNISANFHQTVENQMMWIDGDFITPYDENKKVAGGYAAVEGTPFDFRTPQIISERIDEENAQIKITGGYDHTWAVNTKGDDSRPAAWIYDKESGRKMEIYTTEPGVHVYAANGLKGNLMGKDSTFYAKRTSICFETMHFQNSPNVPEYPTTVLRPGECFNSRTVYKFVIE